jgi:uncharacterized membrane protein YjjP (DUF1212 family)/uncharacterized membrane protein HdeD (DUF308 family)
VSDAPDGELYAFVLEAGRALSLAGASVGETQDRLTRIACAGGAGGVRVIALPTALVISLDATGPATIESIPQLTGALRLDQVSVVYDVVRQAERGALAPAEGLRLLRAMRVLPPRHGRVLIVLGHLGMTVGLCLLLRPTLSDVAIAAGLGALVGALRLAARGVLVPVLCAVLVSALTFAAVTHGIADPGLRTLIAPLVAFLPGGVLAIATIELASGDMVAGASRLVFGALQLLLLTAGIVAGAALVGLPSAAVLHDNPGDLLGWWAPWLGVALFGVAVSVYFSAPRGALPWLMAVLCTAWLGQLAGERLLGANGSGFLGALTMTPVAIAVSRLPGGPPAQVTFLPAFWLLAPGAVGLIGVAESFADPASAGMENLVPPLASILSIALGVLCGTSVYNGLEAAVTRGLIRRGRRPRRARAGTSKVPAKGVSMSTNESGATVVFSGGPTRGWRIGLGLVTVATGALILVWPGAAVVTVAIIVGVHLIVAGVVSVVLALVRDSGRMRVLYLLLGVVLVVAGILCLSSPFHATTLLVVLFGVCWLVNGGIELCHGVMGGGGWTVASGVVSFAAGVVVLAYPAPSARAMAWLFGLTLVTIGLTVFMGAVLGARDRSRLG